jgi:hypothetical protein
VEARSLPPWQQQGTASCEAGRPWAQQAFGGAKAAATGASKAPSGEPAKERRLPSLARTDEGGGRVADFHTDICVGDYLVGKCFFDD